MVLIFYTIPCTLGNTLYFVLKFAFSSKVDVK